MNYDKRKNWIIEKNIYTNVFPSTMTDYKPLVAGLVAEFQAMDPSSSARRYQEAVQSRKLGPKEEEVLLNFAADYWAIQRYRQPSSRRRRSRDVEHYGITGEGFGLVGDILGIAKEVVIDMPLEILTDHTSDELLSHARGYMHRGSNDPNRALAIREEEVIRELQGL